MLERVRHLHLRARQLVAGLYQGTRRSVRLGHDVEFADYKPYSPGDALRDLDWRVLARSDRMVVRRYQAETELACTIVFDASADLGSTPRKFEQAVTLAATLAVFCSLDGEPVGLVLGAGEGVPLRMLPPGAGRRHLAQLLSLLAAVRPAGRAGLDRLFRETGERLGNRSLVAIVGDFAEEPEGWIPSLDALAQRRADLRAFQVYDPDETGLVWRSPLRVHSPEVDGRRPIDPVALRSAFSAEVQTFFGEVRGAVQRRRGQHLLVAADGDLVPVVSRFARGVGDPAGVSGERAA